MDSTIPSWQLYGENRGFPDVLHVERIADRAAGLGWQIAPHRHAHLHQIFLLQAGHAEASLEGRPLPVVLPCALNLPPAVAHGFRFAAGTEGFVLTLPVQEFAEVLGPQGEPAPVLARPFAIAANEPVLAAFQALSAEHAARGAHRRTRLRAQAVVLACDLARLAGAATRPALTERADPRVQHFQALVEARFRDGLAVSGYARALGLSPRHLNRLCQATLGLSASRLIAGVMVREARSLLVYTRMSVASIAYALGFQDPSYFTRAFQREVGLSPSAYRAQFDG